MLWIHPPPLGLSLSKPFLLPVSQEGEPFDKLRVGGFWDPHTIGGVYAASTSTNSLSSIAVIVTLWPPPSAAPSRALNEAPAISIAPVAGTR